MPVIDQSIIQAGGVQICRESIRSMMDTNGDEEEEKDDNEGWRLKKEREEGEKWCFNRLG